MDAFERRYKILMILNKRCQENVANLAIELGASERTILRDIAYLSTFLPIVTLQGKYGCVKFFNNYRYCDYKFYITEEQETILRKIITETQETGVCILPLEDLKALLGIINKYSKNSNKKRKL